MPVVPEARPLEKPLTLDEMLRFWSHVEKTETCWLWTGRYAGAENRSASFCVQSRTISARRVAWQLTHPDDEPLHSRVKLNSSCGDIRCVNPEHLMPTLGGGRVPQETCGRGHEFDEENTYWTTQGKRACRKCIALNGQARRERYLKEGHGWGRSYRPQKSTGVAV